MHASNPVTHGYSTTTRNVMVIVVLFVLIILLLAGMIYIEGRIFDGVRSYVRGEGLWAKAQKDAVLYLERYSYRHDDADFLAFKRAIQVQAGDREARMALQKSPPDIAGARRDLLRGNNDPQDVDAMIWFFLNFRDISYMRAAIETWEAGDNKIDELTSTGTLLKQEISSRHPRPKKIHALREHLRILNGELLVLENHFSQVLGEGARWVKTTVWQLSLALLVFFVGAGSWVSRKIIKAIVKSERELLASESRFTSLKASDTIGIASWSKDGRLIEVNDLLLNMLGYSRMDFEEGRLQWKGLTPVELHERDREALRELEIYGRCEPYETLFLHKQGHTVPVYVGASLLQGDRNQGIAFVIDISERKKAEEELQMAGLVYQAVSEAIIVTDADNRIVSINPAFTDITGYTLHEVIGKDPKLLRSGCQDKDFYENMWHVLLTTGNWQGEVWNRRKNGEIYVEWLTINAIYNPDGSIHRWVALFSDISEKKKAEEIIRHHANYDALTALPNRRMIHDRLEHQIKKARREKRPLALLFVDLDRFKEVNDTHGHEMGDILLKEAADRMLNCVRESDSVGRLGGDEFTIILGELEDNASVKRIVNCLLEKLAEPFELGNETAYISASIGITFYPDDANDITALFRNADQAMYTAKRKGRNGFHYYDAMKLTED